MDTKSKRPAVSAASQETYRQVQQEQDSNKLALLCKWIKKIIVRYGWCAPVLVNFLLNKLKLRKV